MTTERQARIFVVAFICFIALNALWSGFSAALHGDQSEIGRGVMSLALFGTLSYFLWKRSSGVRIFLGIALAATALLYFAADVFTPRHISAVVRVRLGVGGILGLVLLFWRPLRLYTTKIEPNQSPEPTRASAGLHIKPESRVAHL